MRMSTSTWRLMTVVCVSLVGSLPLAASAQDAAETGDDAAFALRLRELEDRVDELKEGVFRTKSRLFLLREQILNRAVGGARTVIRHEAEIGAAFIIDRVLYTLDGEPIYAGTSATANLDRDFVIFDGPVLSGPHNLGVEISLVGNPLGMFSYMDGYAYTLSSSHQFIAEDGSTVNIDSVAYESGRLRTPLEERPNIRFEVAVEDVDADADETASEDGGN
jgi:hypothetical protein